MCGGYFDYVQYRIEQSAEELRSYINKCESKGFEGGYDPNYSKETMDKFKECEQSLRKTAELLHRIDWLVSDDDSEKTFHKLIKEKNL